LRKFNANTGKVIWEYAYDDVIKSSGSIWIDKSKPENHTDRIVIMQGSRRGFENTMSETHIGSYRAVSFGTGKELWQLNIRRTQSFSRDTDGSALVLDDTVFLAMENGYFGIFEPHPNKTILKYGVKQPTIIEEYPLFLTEDIAKHHYNIVVESSPSLIANHIYIPCGSGHVYGFNRDTRALDWDFYVGSDLDGSAVVTRDSCILISVEKQYIKGRGGVFKLNPHKAPEDAVEWYFQSQDSLFADWAGGIIGSVGINDAYIDETQNAMAAFVGIDGELHVVDHEFLSREDSTTGPDGNTCYAMPQEAFTYHVGASISTPIFTENRLIVATYNGLYLFSYDHRCLFTLLDHYDIVVEATPIVYNQKVYIAARDGYFYCLGNR
jgi:outer membrane protein assembly factor BamB